MGQNLYDKLKNLKDDKKSNIGYTVKGYQGVLSDLQQDKVRVVVRQVVRNSAAGTGEQYTTRYYTLLKSDSLNEDVNLNEGFFFAKENDTPLYQGLCSIKDYMSFIVDVGDKKGYVKVQRGGAGLNDGCGLKNGVTFPTCTGCSTTLKQMKENCNGNCYIGVGLSFQQFAAKFFQMYFPDLKLHQDVNRLIKIAGKGMLYAEIAIPNGSGSALYFHGKVTTKYTGTSSGPFEVWMPIPILLLNDFSKICSITVSGLDKPTQVGNGSVLYPLASSRYFHKDASIQGFTPSLIEQYINAQPSVTINYKSSSLHNAAAQKETQGRVRLYFDEQARGSLGTYPDQYNKELFKGHFTSDEVTAKETISIGNSSGNNYIFNAKGGIFLDVGHVGNSVTGTGAGAPGVLKVNGKLMNDYWYNHRIAQSLGKKLTALNIPVTLRDYPSINNTPERRRIKKQFLAEENNYAAFVSIHCNSYGENIKVMDNTPGCSNVYVWGGTEKRRNAQSDVLGNLIAASMRPIMTGSRGSNKVIPCTDRVGILEGMQAPAVLLEVGFVNHLADCKKLADDATLDSLTTSIAQAVDSWVKSIRQ